MRRLAKNWPAFCLAVAITVCPAAYAQVHTTSGSGTVPTTVSGVSASYNWQVDQTGTTTTLSSTFNIPAPLCWTTATVTCANYVQVPVSISYNGSGGLATTTVHAVQGSISLAAWPEGSECSSNQAVAIPELRTVPNLNDVAAVKLQQFPQGTANVPISGTFSTPLSGLTAFQLQVLNDVGCQETLTIQLVMN
jgi:N-methylhydantoinase B/oxoprolinase/acetone carboxylase alpha subunit